MCQSFHVLRLRVGTFLVSHSIVSTSGRTRPDGQRAVSSLLSLLCVRSGVWPVRRRGAEGERASRRDASLAAPCCRARVAAYAGGYIIYTVPHVHPEEEGTTTFKRRARGSLFRPTQQTTQGTHMAADRSDLKSTQESSLRHMDVSGWKQPSQQEHAAEQTLGSAPLDAEHSQLSTSSSRCDLSIDSGSDSSLIMSNASFRVARYFCRDVFDAALGFDLSLRLEHSPPPGTGYDVRVVHDDDARCKHDDDARCKQLTHVRQYYLAWSARMFDTPMAIVPPDLIEGTPTATAACGLHVQGMLSPRVPSSPSASVLSHARPPSDLPALPAAYIHAPSPCPRAPSITKVARTQLREPVSTLTVQPPKPPAACISHVAPPKTNASSDKSSALMHDAPARQQNTHGGGELVNKDDTSAALLLSAPLVPLGLELAPAAPKQQHKPLKARRSVAPSAPVAPAVLSPPILQSLQPVEQSPISPVSLTQSEPEWLTRAHELLFGIATPIDTSPADSVLCNVPSLNVTPCSAPPCEVRLREALPPRPPLSPHLGMRMLNILSLEQSTSGMLSTALEVLSLLLLELLPITLLSPMSLPVGALPSIKEPVISPKKSGALDASLPSVPALNVLSFIAPLYSSTLLSSTWLKEPSLLLKAQSILPMSPLLGMPLHSVLSLVELLLSVPPTVRYLTGLKIPHYHLGPSSPCSLMSAGVISCGRAALSCTTRHRMAMRHRRLCRKGERSARARFLAKG